MTEPKNFRDMLAKRDYIIGYLFALLLTILPFWMVGTNETHAAMRGSLLAFIAVMAVIQIFVHLRYFLHMSFAHTPKEDMAAAAFAVILLGIMVAGTIWIMFDLNARMMTMGGQVPPMPPM